MAKPSTKPVPELDLAIQIDAGSVQVPSRAKLRAWIAAALRARARITLRIVGAREARVLNRDYRGRDYATNVLTFVYSVRPLCADIAICAPVVIREARMRGISGLAHFAHLTVHGVLHARGYDHEQSADAHRMESQEVRILRRLGYADPYAEQAPRIERAPATARARAARANTAGVHGR